jgi:hypothetical protein
MKKQISPGPNSTDEVLMAAFRLSRESRKEFTEWDLTIETWKLNRNRWGLKGHEEYPDHKRVMNEVMAKGGQKVMGKGWIERTRPNYYKITLLGLAKVKSLKNLDPKSQKRNVFLYDLIFPYAFDPVFERFLGNPDEPKSWLDVAAFLRLNKYDYETLRNQLTKIESAIEETLASIKENKEDSLIRDDRNKPLIRERVLKLKEFLEIIQIRFKSQFEAIRSKSS